jgi:hypothetical protein
VKLLHVVLFALDPSLGFSKDFRKRLFFYVIIVELAAEADAFEQT